MVERKVNICTRQRKDWLAGRCPARRARDMRLRISLGRKLRRRNKGYYFSPWNVGENRIRPQGRRTPREPVGNAIPLNLGRSSAGRLRAMPVNPTETAGRSFVNPSINRLVPNTRILGERQCSRNVIKFMPP